MGKYYIFATAFSPLFKNPLPYVEIISLLAKHPKGMTREEISTGLKITTFGKKDGMYSDQIIAKLNMDDLFQS